MCEAVSRTLWSPRNHTAERENRQIYTSARAGNRHPHTLWFECVRARARAGQWASSPAVSDVTVGLCVSGVWSKSITESKKPNATNHVHNSSSIVLCLTLTFSPPSSGSLAEHKCSYSGQRTEYRIAVTHSASARMQTAQAPSSPRFFPTNLSATCYYQQR